MTPKPTCPTCGSEWHTRGFVEMPLGHPATICDNDAFHRSQEPARVERVGGRGLDDHSVVAKAAQKSSAGRAPRQPSEPAPEGELERARPSLVALRAAVLGFADAGNPFDKILDALISAERTDAARQERRRTLEEVARLIDPEKPDHETTWLLDRLEEMSLNERIREAGRD